MREWIDIAERFLTEEKGPGRDPVAQLMTPRVQRGLQRRARVLTIEDIQEMSARFSSTADFAWRLVDEASPSAKVAEQALAAAWAVWHPNGNVPKPPPFNPQGLVGAIAKAIGASAMKPAKEPSWGSDMISAPNGYILSTPKGDVFLDAQVNDGDVWMSEISVERPGNALGREVMEAIHQYALKIKGNVRVFKVVNRRFFDGFSWLHDVGDMEYRSDFYERKP